MRSLLATAALVATLSSCAFAVKHPAATVAIVGGVIAAGTCEIGTDFEGEHATCGLVTLGTAAVLGGIVLLATVLGGEGNTILHGPDEEPERQVPQDPTLDAPKPAVPQDPTLDAPKPAVPDPTLDAPKRQEPALDPPERQVPVVPPSS